MDKDQGLTMWHHSSTQQSTSQRERKNSPAGLALGLLTPRMVRKCNRLLTHQAGGRAVWMPSPVLISRPQSKGHCHTWLCHRWVLTCVLRQGKGAILGLTASQSGDICCSSPVTFLSSCRGISAESCHDNGRTPSVSSDGFLSLCVLHTIAILLQRGPK